MSSKVLGPVVSVHWHMHTNATFISLIQSVYYLEHVMLYCLLMLYFDSMCVQLTLYLVSYTCVVLC